MKRLRVFTSLLCALLLAGCNLIGCKSSPGPEQAQNDAGGGGTATPSSTNDIDVFLAKKPSVANPSPLVGQGANFQSYGKEYDIDPRLIVAITAAETSYATAKCHSTPVVTTHNAWNWFYSDGSTGTDVCVDSSFDTWDSGIHTLSHFMRKSYVNKGYDTVELIKSKYCIEGCDNWIPNVTASMKQMNGNPNSLTLSGTE